MYTGIERMLVSGGGGDDWIFDPSDVDTEIYGDAGNDTIVVDSASADVVVDGGDDSDAVIVSCGSLNGAIDVGDSGTVPGETNSLTVKGTLGDDDFAVTSGAVAWGSTETITYSPTITSLSVETGPGANSVQIVSTSPAGVTITTG